MKAYNLRGVGQLVYEDVRIPDVPKGWTLVKVKASSICSSDIPRIFVKGTYHFPTIPGHEFSGIVEKVGHGVEPEWVGKKVGVFPLIPCMNCDECKKGNYARCSSYDYIGSRRDGAFAEYVLVPEWNLIELSDKIPFRISALLEPLTVAQHAINAIGDSEINSIAIIGTGAIGFMAAIWAKERGIDNIDVIARDMRKGNIANDLGVNLRTESLNGYDCVIEAVGSKESIIQSIQIVKPGGTVVMMGNPAGDINLPQNDYWKILRKEITIKGVWNSSYGFKVESEWVESVRLVESNKYNLGALVTHIFSSTELQKALKLMKNHEEPYCRVVILWD